MESGREGASPARSGRPGDPPEHLAGTGPGVVPPNLPESSESPGPQNPAESPGPEGPEGPEGPPPGPAERVPVGAGAATPSRPVPLHLAPPARR
ncbi:hypothetical protein FNX48_014850 [Streptomyces sp. IF17]|nr:hypothetical protein [Streptomyces alkaliphilus]